MSGFIDISIPITDKMLVYSGDPEVRVERVLSIEGGNGSNVSRLEMGSHTGTHIDAPLHFLPDGADVLQIPLEAMNGQVKVIEIAGSEIDLSALDEIEAGDRVIFKTENSVNFDCVSLLEVYVTLSYDAARCLAEKQVKLVGIDYLSIEPPKCRRLTDESVHKTLLTVGVVVLEGLRLAKVKPGRYELMCLPLSLAGCDGSPVRAVLKN